MNVYYERRREGKGRGGEKRRDSEW